MSESFYIQEALTKRSNVAWVRTLQDTALSTFAQLNFPTRKDEAFKNTPIQSIVSRNFACQSGVSFVKDTLPKTIQRVFVNGETRDTTNLPEGVLVLSLQQAIHDYPAKIQPYLGHILQHSHGVSALNTAFLADGCFIYVPADVVVPDPLALVHWQDRGARYWRHVVVLEAGSAITLVEDYAGEAQYLTNTVTEIYLAEHANCTYYKHQRESMEAVHFGQVSVKQCVKSSFNSHLFSVGGVLARNDITIDLAETGAICNMQGVYVPRDKQLMDNNTAVYHNVAGCDSTQDYRGLLRDSARAVFAGYVYVAPNAAATVANQQNKNILLSPVASVVTKPQLDIFASDVTCSHGATVGQLDEDALFYFATRGIARNFAIQALTAAFIAAHVAQITDPIWAAWLVDLMQNHVGDMDA